MEAMKIQCFERKPRVWIGPGREAEDIMIPEMACSLLLLRGQFLAKWEAEAEGKNSGGEVLRGCISPLCFRCVRRESIFRDFLIISVLQE